MVSPAPRFVPLSVSLVCLGLSACAGGTVGPSTGMGTGGDPSGNAGEWRPRDRPVAGRPGRRHEASRHSGVARDDRRRRNDGRGRHNRRGGDRRGRGSWRQRRGRRARPARSGGAGGTTGAGGRGGRPASRDDRRAGTAGAGGGAGADLAERQSKANSDTWLSQNHTQIAQLRPRVLVIDLENTAATTARRWSLSTSPRSRRRPASTSTRTRQRAARGRLPAGEDRAGAPRAGRRISYTVVEHAGVRRLEHPDEGSGRSERPEPDVVRPVRKGGHQRGLVHGELRTRSAAKRRSRSSATTPTAPRSPAAS